MRRPGAWGDHLTLIAAASILERPIRVVSDRADEGECETVVHPLRPAPGAAAPPIYVAQYGERRYEATAPAS
eukprot:692743-Lingulodinium_polyedra.AAC.1